MDQFNEFADFITYNSLGDVVLDASLAGLTTLKIGGCGAAIYYPDCYKSLKKAFRYIISNHMDYYVIGNGSNLLISNRYHERVFINLKNLNNYEIKNNVVYVEAGVSGNNIAKIVSKMNLSGIEFLAGIPGNMGGIIYMNAGAWNKDISKVLRKVIYLDEYGEECVIDNYFTDTFSYRSSPFINKKAVIVACEISLKNPPKNIDPYKIFMNYLDKKKATQPLNVASAGCAFKNPRFAKAWELIQNSGCENLKIGEASVSKIHKNFLINESNATFSDMEELLYLVQAEVYEKYQVKLEVEWCILK